MSNSCKTTFHSRMLTSAWANTCRPAASILLSLRFKTLSVLFRLSTCAMYDTPPYNNDRKAQLIGLVNNLLQLTLISFPLISSVTNGPSFSGSVLAANEGCSGGTGKSRDVSVISGVPARIVSPCSRENRASPFETPPLFTAEVFGRLSG